MTDQPNWGLYLQNGPGYLGELATPNNIVEYAVAAEQSGWDGVYLADGLTSAFQTVDPWITLAGIATNTDEIRLGTWVTPIPRRQPWQVAQDLATLDHLSNGRVILGAGLGNKENYTCYGEEWNPREIGDRYDEALELIAAFWTDEEVDFAGEYYQVSEVALHLSPIQEPRIPILCGCWWPNKRPLQRGARWDGIMPVAPAFYGKEGIQGEPITGSPEEALNDIIAYYHDVADEPGDIVVQVDPPAAPDNFASLCKEAGVTWLLTGDLLDSESHEENLRRIREGPQQ